MNPRSLLEDRITEAVDGLLDEAALRQIEIELTDYPDLLQEFHAQIAGTGLSEAYAGVQPSMFAVTRLRQRLRNAEAEQWQYDVIRIFKRYVLTSGIGIILLVAASHALPVASAANTELTISEELGLLLETIEQDALEWPLPNMTEAEDHP